MAYRERVNFTSPLPESLSPSRLADFQTCPRRYQYASVERRPQPASYASAKGRFAHFIFEQLFRLPAEERTIARAREFVGPATEAVLTPSVREEISLTDDRLARLLSETDAIVVSYFEMEDPRTVHHEGVELRLGADVNGTPLFGILDRLDREESGELTIVDYKTGALPNRRFDSQTFANSELYAVLCRGALGEQPTKIRLLYVAHGESVERPVTDVVVSARSDSATRSWERIQRYYVDGEFPATPSPRACRFCSFKELCRAEGVPVPV